MNFFVPSIQKKNNEILANNKYQSALLRYILFHSSSVCSSFMFLPITIYRFSFSPCAGTAHSGKRNCWRHSADLALIIPIRFRAFRIDLIFVFCHLITQAVIPSAFCITRMANKSIIHQIPLSTIFIFCSIIFLISIYICK